MNLRKGVLTAAELSYPLIANLSEFIIRCKKELHSLFSCCTVNFHKRHSYQCKQRIDVQRYLKAALSENSIATIFLLRFIIILKHSITAVSISSNKEIIILVLIEWDTFAHFWARKFSTTVLDHICILT